MSFECSVSDAVILVRLAWWTLRSARHACGEHAELTREISSLNNVLQYVRQEISNPDSPINRVDNHRREELWDHIAGCERVLNIVVAVSAKYSRLEESGRGKKLWQNLQFGEAGMHDLVDIRLKISTHTSAITMSLHLLSLEMQGLGGEQLSNQDRDHRGIGESVNWVAAKMRVSSQGSTLTSYSNCDKAFWKSLHRDLMDYGYSSSVLHRQRTLVKAYISELCSKGILDKRLEMRLTYSQLDQNWNEGNELPPAPANTQLRQKVGVSSTVLPDLEIGLSDFPHQGKARGSTVVLPMDMSHFSHGPKVPTLIHNDTFADRPSPKAPARIQVKDILDGNSALGSRPNVDPMERSTDGDQITAGEPQAGAQISLHHIDANAKMKLLLRAAAKAQVAEIESMAKRYDPDFNLDSDYLERRGREREIEDDYIEKLRKCWESKLNGEAKARIQPWKNVEQRIRRLLMLLREEDRTQIQPADEGP